MNRESQMHSFNSNEYSEGNFDGLTKYEHMVIEFTKALISNPSICTPDSDFDVICETGIMMVNSTIKNLNKF